MVLSHKQRRHQRRKQQTAVIADSEEIQPEKQEPEPGIVSASVSKKRKHGEFCAWIGNLRFTTTPSELREFLESKCDKEEIVKIEMPPGIHGPNSGFAFVEVNSSDALANVVSLSETTLFGRALLIKDANTTKPPKKRKNTSQLTHPTLFVGNLPFETQKQELHDLFDSFGPLGKIRLATFEDSGKCKGFAYLDFEEVESAQKVMLWKKPFLLQGRRLRIEAASEEAARRGQSKKR